MRKEIFWGLLDTMVILYSVISFSNHFQKGEWFGVLLMFVLQVVVIKNNL